MTPAREREWAETLAGTFGHSSKCEHGRAGVALLAAYAKEVREEDAKLVEADARMDMYDGANEQQRYYHRVRGRALAESLRAIRAREKGGEG